MEADVWTGEFEMENSFLAFMEMFIILAFALGWCVLELVTLRLDRKRQAARERSDGEAKTPDRA
jgi:thiosulfate reductase cytochrome b subunit